MKIHKVAIIGYGGFGQFLQNSWSKLDNVDIVAVADEIAARNPGGSIRFYNNWRDILKDEEVEIVSIVTPPSSHAQIACELMEAGKNVLIEKPIATTLEDGKKILETQKKTGKVAGVNYMLRFNPVVEALGQICKEGLLGKLRHVDVENYAQDEGLPVEHWFWNTEIAGGILIEHAVHFIDLTHSLIDQDILTVNGLRFKRNNQQEDQVLASVCYNEGFIATHYHSFARPGFFEDTSMRFNFDLAQINVHGWIPLNGCLNAIVTNAARDRLAQLLPNFKITSATDTAHVRDDSRPEGWGETETAESRKKAVSGGIEYKVDQMINAKFSIAQDKQDVYADCVRGMMTDIIRTIENPSHQQKVTVEDGYKSLEVAYKATRSGRASCP